MEAEQINYDYLNVRELKVVCKFFKIDIPPRAKRDQLEALLIMAQTQMAMSTVQAYEHYLVQVAEEAGIPLADISGTPLDPS